MQIVADDMGRGSKLAQAIGRSGSFSVVLLDRYKSVPPARRLVICDLDLRKSDIVRQARDLLAHYRKANIPCIFLFDSASHHQETQALALGAFSTVPRERAAAALIGEIARVLALSVTVAIDETLGTLNTVFAAAANGQAFSQQDVETCSTILLGSIESSGVVQWLNQSWSIDQQTSQHCLLVAGLAAGFASHLGFAAADRLDLTHAAILHDVGKARIPEHVLHKQGRLDDTELAIMRAHPMLGWQLLTEQNYDGERLLDAVLHHHEMLDGSGYPDGLAGTQISDFVRIITLSDIFGALIERRSYKPTLPVQQALDIMEGMGPRLDRDLLRAFSSFVRTKVAPDLSQPEPDRQATA